MGGPDGLAGAVPLGNLGGPAPVDGPGGLARGTDGPVGGPGALGGLARGTDGPVVGPSGLGGPVHVGGPGGLARAGGGPVAPLPRSCIPPFGWKVCTPDGRGLA